MSDCQKAMILLAYIIDNNCLLCLFLMMPKGGIFMREYWIRTSGGIRENVRMGDCETGM